MPGPDFFSRQPSQSSDEQQTRDQLMRVSAELENVRKRSKRDLEQQRRFAEADLLKELLPVLDNLRRAQAAAATAESQEEVLRGIQMIAEQLQNILTRHQCEEVSAAGQPFDPAIHEAVRQEVVPNVPPGIVVRVLEPGYRLHDRVLRPAKVVVSG